MTTYAKYPYAIGTEAVKLDPLAADPATDPAGSICYTTGGHFRGKNATGWVDLDVQQYARVTRATAQSIAHGTFTIVTPYTAVGSNVGGLWNAGAPDRLTIQEAGFYLVGGHVNFAQSSGGEIRSLYVQAGGLNLAPQASAKFAAATVDISAVGAIGLIASHIVQLMVYHDAGVALNVTAAELWVARVA
jgi:hypothetical protein